MRIAYLMNQHPYLTSPFIGRELAGLEALGVEVIRFSVRRPEIELVDDADKKELEKTRFILDVGMFGLLVALIRVVMTRPLRFMYTAWLTLKVARKANQLLRHLAYLAEACVLLRWLSKSDSSVVHAHFGSNATTVAMLCHALGGPPYSFTVHGPGEFDEPRAIALPEKIKRARFVVAISSFARSQLYRWCDYKQWSKIEEVHCGVDETFLNAVPRPFPKEPRLVCVGKLCEHKGHLQLLEAAARITGEGFQLKLTLVGDGPLRSTIDAQVAELGLKDNVEITGWASGTEVQEQILRSQVMVLPSSAEGLPVVIMEALALGRPVISTYVAGIPELVVPGVCGWLVPAGSVECLAESMREALQTPIEQLRAMGAAGMARVSERHNAAIEARKLKQGFEVAITDGKQRGATREGDGGR